MSALTRRCNPKQVAPDSQPSLQNVRKQLVQYTRVHPNRDRALQHARFRFLCLVHKQSLPAAHNNFVGACDAAPVMIPISVQ